MAWWTLAMLANPEIQARAQAELDAVVGHTRLPNLQTTHTSLTFVLWSKKLAGALLTSSVP
ncbi:hypothetical protein EDB89DRAFT_1967198 [Lactarius sanguifluus]|nr:hypothetical protein EDB89DRAFT_1967198 [Lactarius sanguifluus]